MKLYPNQRLVKVTADGSRKNERHAIITDAEILTACKLLNDKSSAMAVYFYLARNDDGTELALSPAQINRDIHLSTKACHAAINRLKDIGYLVPSEVEGEGNVLMFRRTPDQERKVF